MVRILAIPGSLRINSSSNQILNSIISFAAEGTSIELFDGLRSLPHFDDPNVIPDSVSKFRNMVRAADAVLICTPEYAFGIPGSLKNALDWLVSSSEFVDKPIGLITAATQGEKGHAALILVLTAMSSNLISDATLLISFVKSKLDSDGNIIDEEVIARLKHALNNLVKAASHCKKI